MRYTTLGNTADTVSILGCGTMWFTEMTQTETDRALNYALDSGVTYFDCARGYGDAEIKVGKAIGHRRDEIFMATKAAGRDAATAGCQIDESLERLGMDHIDLIQLHYVNYQHEFDQIMAPGGALEAAIKAREDGKVRHIGITGHRPEKLAGWLRLWPYETVLFHLNPLQPWAALDLLSTTSELGVGTMAMRPVGSGLLNNERACDAIRYAHQHAVDVVVSGLTSPAIVDANVDALAEPVGAEEASRHSEWAATLVGNDCRRCNYCSCPVGIDVPNTMLSERVVAAGEQSEAGEKLWREATASVDKCYGHEPCQTEPICESKCPYDLPIRQLMLKLSSAEPVISPT
jgi:hypothetical protein